MVAYMDAHPRCGAAGPRLVLPSGELDLACRRSLAFDAFIYRMLGLSRLFPRSRRFGQYNLTYLSPEVETEVGAVVGACMLVRREAIAQAGLLDEAFFMYGEDLDWAIGHPPGRLAGALQPGCHRAARQARRQPPEPPGADCLSRGHALLLPQALRRQHARPGWAALVVAWHLAQPELDPAARALYPPRRLGRGLAAARRHPAPMDARRFRTLFSVLLLAQRCVHAEAGLRPGPPPAAG